MSIKCTARENMNLPRENLNRAMEDLLLPLSVFTLVQRPPNHNLLLLALLLIRARRKRRLHLALQNIYIAYLRRKRKSRKRFWVLPRPQYWFQGLLNSQALDFWWKENFRISRETFEFICRTVGPALQRQDTHLREAMSVQKRVAVSLWRLATGECYRSCGMIMGISKSSAIICTHEFVRELCAVQDAFIKFPITEDEVKDKVKGFSEISKIPNVCGAIDGTHFPIKAPQENHEDYFNRKHFYSFVTQGITDSNGLFLSVSTGYPGSIHDARVLRLSQVSQMAENEDVLAEPTIEIKGTDLRPLIVGDSAYPLKTWLICPFRYNGVLTPEQRRFNRELSRGRVVIEQAFGLMKGRWRVLMKRLDEDTERVPSTILACCILHNICTMRNDVFDAEFEEEAREDEEYYGGVPGEAAETVRQAIVEYLADE